MSTYEHMYTYLFAFVHLYIYTQLHLYVNTFSHIHSITHAQTYILYIASKTEGTPWTKSMDTIEKIDERHAKLMKNHGELMKTMENC